MPIKFQCNSCGKQYSLSATHAGKAARCSCGAIVTVPHPTPAMAAAPAGAPPILHSPPQPTDQPTDQPISYHVPDFQTSPHLRPPSTLLHWIVIGVHLIVTLTTYASIMFEAEGYASLKSHNSRSSVRVLSTEDIAGLCVLNLAMFYGPLTLLVLVGPWLASLILKFRLPKLVYIRAVAIAAVPSVVTALGLLLMDILFTDSQPVRTANRAAVGVGFAIIIALATVVALAVVTAFFALREIFGFSWSATWIAFAFSSILYTGAFVGMALILAEVRRQML